jgi:hypothetical protein
MSNPCHKNVYKNLVATGTFANVPDTIQYSLQLLCAKVLMYQG